MRLLKMPKLKPLTAKVAELAAKVQHDHGHERLVDLPPVANNPGRLDARVYVPASLGVGAGLVVVLHGCTQNAVDYDRGSGWSQLADRHGFALLYPQQIRANNPNNCFNWFTPGDIRRDGGEVASIRAQVAVMIAAHAIDPARVFVTGLSAGGAMAAALLATYPEVFAAGAIVAGLPYACASGVPQALEAMSGRGAAADAATLSNRVRKASAHAGPWPRVSVWHGTADRTVASVNGDALVRQWTDIHGLPAKPTRTESTRGTRHSIWTGADGVPLVEHVMIDGMGHGTPLHPGTAPGEAGEAGAYMLDVGISSTDRIAAFFGLAPASTGQTRRPVTADRVANAPILFDERSASPDASMHGPQKIIEDALRAVGLMR